MENDELEIRLRTIEEGIEQLQIALDKLERSLAGTLIVLQDRVSTLEYYRRA